jgi:hypothetical protein
MSEPVKLTRNEVVAKAEQLLKAGLTRDELSLLFVQPRRFTTGKKKGSPITCNAEVHYNGIADILNSAVICTVWKMQGLDRASVKAGKGHYLVSTRTMVVNSKGEFHKTAEETLDNFTAAEKARFDQLFEAEFRRRMALLETEKLAEMEEKAKAEMENAAENIAEDEFGDEDDEGEEVA